MAHVQERRLKIKTGIQGPTHDPWGFEDFIFIENGEKTVLRLSLAVQLHHKGEVRVWRTEEEATPAFKEATGLTPNEFWKAHNRIHPFNPNEHHDPFFGEA